MADSKWKSALLRSGVPLEHDVARFLTNEGFYISPDFEFHRVSGGVEKEFSVDLDGTFYGHPDRLDYTLHILAECKYRSPEKSLLLFEETNPEMGGTLGGTLTVSDQFVPFYARFEPIAEFERQFPFAYKAVELHEGSAVERDIKHGLAQLKYATPSFVVDHVVRSLFEHEEDRHPNFFASLLITNAPLRLVDSETSLDQVNAAAALTDITTEVPWAVISHGIGPEYRAHVGRVVQAFDREELIEKAEEVEKHVISGGKKNVLYSAHPVNFTEGILSGGYELTSLCSQVFIVNLASMPRFIGELKAATKAAFRRRLKASRFKSR